MKEKVKSYFEETSSALAGGASSALAGGASSALAGGASSALAGGASSALAGGASSAQALLICKKLLLCLHPARNSWLWH